MKTIKEIYTSTITIQKSEFICHVFPVNTVEEANTYLANIRKNCYGYIIGNNGEIAKYSDDGEPSQTAGVVIYDVLKKNDLTNVLAIVTRYFGGIKLGAGGLVRAYSGSTKEGLLASKVITKMHGQQLTIDTDYTGLGKIQYILGQRGIRILDSVYTDKVELEVLLPEAEIGTVMSEIREGTNGQAIMELSEECYFAEIDGEMQIFED